MIPRYTRQEMASIWEPENRFKIWLEIELLALEGWAKLKVVPEDVVKTCRAKARFSIDRIDTLERELKHDVIAFLTCVAEFIGPEARFMHRGMTSSDVIDTAFGLQLKQAGELLLADIDRILSILKLRAHEFKNTLQIGRSHGIHGEPITFGLKLALWYEEMKRNRTRLQQAIAEVAVGKISGAMGNFVHLEPSIEEYVCKKLGLTPDPISTQIIQRDRHAAYFSTLAVIATTIDQIATEIRHLQRTEVLEVEEYFSKGQKGSSAMPHKKNPILSENLSGLSRLLRGYAVTAFDNVPLWHERDISHSSAERIIGPDATVTLDFMLNRLAGLLEKLVVHPENMKANLGKMRGIFFSQRILLALTDKGVSREDSYRIVQDAAMKVWDENKDFKDALLADVRVTKKLSASEIDSMCHLDQYLRHVDSIFARVFVG